MGMRWNIWYADGSQFSSEDGDPTDAPGMGVVCMAQEVPDAHAITVSHDSFNTVHGYDWYIRYDDQWFATNLMGLCQYIADGGPLAIKMGRWVAKPLWESLYKQAAAWNG